MAEDRWAWLFSLEKQSKERIQRKRWTTPWFVNLYGVWSRQYRDNHGIGRTAVGPRARPR